MQIIGYFIGFVIVGGMILLLIGAFAALFKIGKIIWKSSDSKKGGDSHDGWSDGTWYGGL